jgi:type I restriction enzyme S subunit
VAALEQALRKLDQYRQAVLNAASSGTLVLPEAEIEPRDGRSFETAEQLLRRVHQLQAQTLLGGVSESPEHLFALPMGWSWARLADLLSEPLRNGHSAKASGTGEGIRTLTLSAVTNRDFSVKNTKLTVADPARVANLWLEPGDILIERSNTPQLVGTAALYPGERAFAIFPDLLIRARIAEPLLASYVEIVLRSDRSRQFFRQRAQGIAGSMPKIDQSTVLNLPVPLPPLPEQYRIVAEVERRLSIVAEIETVVANSLIRAARLRQSILRQAFAGQLVPQDPTDEPASVLLERIRLERASAPGKRPKRAARDRHRQRLLC